MSSVAVVSAAECCGECTTAAGCTHWVYEPGKSMARTKNCHIKRTTHTKPFMILLLYRLLDGCYVQPINITRCIQNSTFKLTRL